jgi:hypothetical protein
MRAKVARIAQIAAALVLLALLLGLGFVMIHFGEGTRPAHHAEQPR